MKRKLLTMLLALCVMAGTAANPIMGMCVQAEENAVDTVGIDGGSFEYKILEDGTAEIKDYYSINEKVVVPEEIDGIVVTSIGACAFYDFGNITEVTLPTSVTKINSQAFSYCRNMESITISNNVTYIGYAAFEECKSLTSINIPAGVTRIETSTFEGCKNLTSINIPSSVTSIRGCAFDSCESLANITIPISVTSIGEAAFARCESLKDVYYAGSQEQWKEIAIGKENKPLLSATIHYGTASPVYKTAKPKKMTLSSVRSNKKKTAVIKWKKDSTVSGYIIECATDKKFKKNKVQKEITKAKTTSTTIKKLKPGKKYYVHICAYVKSGNIKVQGDWSKTKTVKVKK